MAILDLAGVTFSNEDGSSRQDALKEILDDFWPDRMNLVTIVLVPEEGNPHDANAVAVVAWVPFPAPCQRGARQLKVGYVPREQAPLVRKALALDLVGPVTFAELGVSTGKKQIAWAKIKLAKKR